MDNSDFYRLIFFLTPFLSAHITAVVLTYALFKFVPPAKIGAKHVLPLWKLGPMVYIGMTLIQMFVENYYLKMNSESRLTLRLATDMIIGWSSFFGMITFYISSREIYAFLTNKKSGKFFALNLKNPQWIDFGLIICVLGLLISTGVLTLINSSVVDILGGKLRIYHIPLLMGGLILYSFFMWCMEKIQNRSK